MNKALKSFEIIKKMYKYFVKNYRDLEPKLMICEKEDFDNVENALKEYELMKNIKIIVSDKKISDEDLEKLKDQRMFVGSLEQCEVKPLFDERTQKKLKALEIIKSCLVGEYEVLDNCSIDNSFKSPYRFRIYMDGITFNEWILKDKEEFDLLKETLL